MKVAFQKALLEGAERVAAWSDLLDAINVFPVADGDTGRNLVISLSPLRRPEGGAELLVRRLLLAARGNSGNIAVQFLAGLLAAESTAALPGAVRDGRARAWQAVHRPVSGTMLEVFDALAGFVEGRSEAVGADDVPPLIDRLEAAVRATHDRLPRLRRAGVVDAGALGMFLFLEGFFHRLVPGGNGFREIVGAFRDRLRVAAAFREEAQPRYCVDTVVRPAVRGEGLAERLGALGADTVLISHGDVVKLHLHTDDRAAVRRALESVGRVERWSEDDMARQMRERPAFGDRRQVHVMTDAAGSVTREDARRLGITLLSSYITVDDTSLPESLVSPQTLYQAMTQGRRASTSQASVFERHEHYRRVLAQHEQVVYLCVGSAYTGNYDTVMAWKQANDPHDRLTVIDSGAASGRLGAVALAAARRAAAGADAAQVTRFARRALGACREFIFLERLKYLAAGGRLSKTRAVFGDLLHLKPVVSPTAEGAQKVAAVRNRSDQLEFALGQLGGLGGGTSLVMLEYTDNRRWVEDTLLPAVRRKCPTAEVRLQPLSLTTGVHTGPGTWALALLPEDTAPDHGGDADR